MLLSDYQADSGASPERKQSPRKTRGFCIVRLFDEQRVLFGYGFPTGLTPPKINKQHTMPGDGCKADSLFQRLFNFAHYFCLRGARCLHSAEHA